MKLRSSLALILLLFAGMISAHAQVGSAIVTAAANFATNTSDVITVKAQIVSCGNGQLPLYNNLPISLTPNQTVLAPFTATNTGLSQSISFTVPGNNAISCGGQNYSLYAITWYDNGFPLAPSQTFRFTDATTQSLYNLTPISFIPPVIVNSAGALCPSATPVFSGFDQFYHIICGVAGSTASLPVVGIFQVSSIGPYTTIQAAVSAAGSIGMVWIMPSYTGTDGWVNPNNIDIEDFRPHNPTNASIGPNGPAPGTTIKASTYGVRCDGFHDDTSAINSALAAATIIEGGLDTGAVHYMGPATVELPQGLCKISSTLISKDFGSLVGSGNGTWIQALDPWLGTTGDMIDVTTSYFPTATTGNHGIGISMINRSVKNINFIYNAATVAHTAIHVFNPTGKTQTQPFPNNAQFLQFQIPGVTISGDSFYAMDTAVEFDDCGECFFINNQVNFVRLGVFDNGNNFGLNLDDNAIQAGTWQYTPNKSGATIAIQAQASAAWTCTNNNVNCSGGTSTLTAITSPQGLTIHGNDVTTFDTNLFVANMQGLTVTDNGFDFAGDGAEGGTTNPSILLGATIDTTVISHNYIASNQTAGQGIVVSAPVTPGAGNAETYNDLTISENYFDDYAGTGTAITFATGTFVRQGVKLLNNTFFAWSNAISMLHPLRFSLIRGNYGVNMAGGGTLINFQATGASSFQGTVVADNTSPNGILIVTDSAGSGYQLGFNQSASQLLGTQVLSATGCAITAGAIGNSCLTTFTFPGSSQPDNTTYGVVCTPTSVTVGPVAVADVVSPTTSGFQVRSVAMSTAASGGGTINCTVTAVN